MDQKIITKQNTWNAVSDELSHEHIKPSIYDNTLINLIGNVENKKILDYGCGPGILASTLTKLGSSTTKAFDISEDMQKKAGEKIGFDNIYNNILSIPEKTFDYITCNLVLCIVDEEEVLNIMANIHKSLCDRGTAFIGFCNPLIFNVKHSQLDMRTDTPYVYCEHHKYWKIKKEGEYKILEIHRPISWYTQVFEKLGFELKGIHFTPEYSYNKRCINDFIIFEITKN